MRKGYDVRISVYETSRSGVKLGTISFLYEVAQALSSTDYIDIYVEDGRLYFEESTSLSGCKISRGKVQFQAACLIDLVEPYSGLVYDIVKDVAFSGTRHYVELKEGRDGSTNYPSRLGIAKNNPCKRLGETRPSRSSSGTTFADKCRELFGDGISYSDLEDLDSKYSKMRSVNSRDDTSEPAHLLTSPEKVVINVMTNKALGLIELGKLDEAKTLLKAITCLLT